MRFDDPELVRREYASEERFLARRVTFVDYVKGQNAEQLALEALAEVEPARVLEVGCGTGAFAERVARELGASVVALDISPHMVELARRRGVEALVGTAEELPFADETFDCAVANWVLHHVPDLDRGLAEIDRVLRPGGRFLAATFGEDDIFELWELLGDPTVGELEFSSENGEATLRRHFDRVERRDADGVVVFPDHQAVRTFLENVIRGAELIDNLPEFEGPFVATSRQALFIGTRSGIR
ncbi:MAG TPA: class I SAM-dependent methyltransferase [Gaiellaceae bacterium]|nr:class I SAM-dependent methyltransferase [Gaiellaceae bacterium]